MRGDWDDVEDMISYTLDSTEEDKGRQVEDEKPTVFDPTTPREKGLRVSTLR